tara:strand:- start:430 stop:624 length:195 start_codon:yes stop_codon:yes gene_type:complete
MEKTIGNFKVELGLSGAVIMIKDLKGNLLKAESIKPFDSEDKFNELCEQLAKKIAERTEKGLSV